MRGNSAARYVEKPRLGASGVKMTPENLIEINLPGGNFKIPQNRLWITIVEKNDTCMIDISQICTFKEYMLATYWKLFEILFHGSYMRIVPQHVSGYLPM